MSTFLEIALRNAGRGLRVFPVRSGTKEPHIRDYPDLAIHVHIEKASSIG